MMDFVMGPWRVQLLETGQFALDGGAMFGSAPRVLWQKLLPPDAAHRIPLALRVLLLRHISGQPVVLVDTGIGDKFDERFARMFAIENLESGSGKPPLEAALDTVGVCPEEVTHVILTHLHFDHAGGVSWRSKGSVRPTFPRAEHLSVRGLLGRRRLGGDQYGHVLERFAGVSRPN